MPRKPFIGNKPMGFITGSHAYGYPTEKSDVDLVLRLPPDLIAFLREQSDENPERDGEWHIIRFGRLNIVACPTNNDFDGWYLGTKECQRDPKGMGKDRARVVFNKIREKLGIKEEY